MQRPTSPGENRKRKPQVSPLRFAPVETTKLLSSGPQSLGEESAVDAATLSSRPERSAVERPAVSSSVALARSLYPHKLIRFTVYEFAGGRLDQGCFLFKVLDHYLGVQNEMVR